MFNSCIWTKPPTFKQQNNVQTKERMERKMLIIWGRDIGGIMSAQLSNGASYKSKMET